MEYLNVRHPEAEVQISLLSLFEGDIREVSGTFLFQRQSIWAAHKYTPRIISSRTYLFHSSSNVCTKCFTMP